MAKFTIKHVLLLVAVCAVACWALTPAWDASYQRRCRANLRDVGLALHAYHAEYGCFPPAYTVDAAGRRLLSWRVLILPHLGEPALHAAFDLAEPWDGPRNRALLRRMPAAYACPAHREAADEGRTAYQVIVGAAGLFPGPRSTRSSQIVCGPDQALAVLEVLHREVPWAAPLDLEWGSFDYGGWDPRRSLAYPPRYGTVGRHHAGEEYNYPDGTRLWNVGTNFVFADGSVRRSGLGLGPGVAKRWALIRKSREIEDRY